LHGFDSPTAKQEQLGPQKRAMTFDYKLHKRLAVESGFWSLGGIL
jgi:hypothetical protein